MLEDVKSYIKEHGLINNNDKIVMGISGGADSVCLLFVMMEMGKQYNIQLIAVHINHGMRGKDSDEDELFTELLCKDYGIPFYSKKVDINRLSKDLRMSEEEAGRYIRYNTFNEVCEEFGANKIAVAHNLDDQAETILLNLIRGSGLKGLCGMQGIRDNIIRPLLCVKRESIEGYLSEKRIEYRVDKTNLSDEYTRNKLRLHLLPFIEKEINEKVKENIVRNASILRETENYVEKMIQNAYTKVVKIVKDIYKIDKSILLEEDIIIQKGLIRKVIGNAVGSLKDISAEHIEQVVLLADKETGKRINLPYKITALRTYDTIDIFIDNSLIDNIEVNSNNYNEEVIVPSNLYCPLIKKNIELKLINYKKSIIISENVYTKHLDYDKINSKSNIRLRTRCEGDYIEINGGKKKLKRYFIDEKIPKDEREHIPLLADGNHIIWIVGYRISEAYKVTDNTKTILEIKIDKGDEYV